jgi:hypothetical protein
METGRVNRPTQRSSTQPAQPAPPEPPAQEAPPASARRARPSPSPQLEPLAENRPAPASQPQINPQRARMLRQQALTRLHNMTEAAQAVGVEVGRFGLETFAHFGQQALAVGATTFGRQQLGEYLKTALVHLPMKHQIAIFTGVQVLNAGLQALRTQQLYREPEAAAQSLAGESSAQWLARTGVDGNRTPEQQLQHDRSMRNVHIAAAAVGLTQLAATAINTGLMVYGAQSNDAKLTSSVLANELKTFPYVAGRDSIQALISFISEHPETHGMGAGQYTAATGVYGAASTAGNFATNPFSARITDNSRPGAQLNARQAARAMLINTIIETIDWQTQNRLAQSHATVSQNGNIPDDVESQSSQSTNPAQERARRAQQFGFGSSPEDLTRLLGQTPGRFAANSLVNAVAEASEIGLGRTGLTERQQNYIGAAIAGLASAVSHITTTAEWDAQSAVRTAVRNRSNDTDSTSSSGDSASTEYYDAPSRLSTDSSGGVAPSNAGSSDDDTDSSSQYHDARSRL